MEARCEPLRLGDLERLAGIAVAVLGDVMLDRYVWGEVSRISPEAPVQVVRVLRSTHNLGGAGNVAANLAALGLEAHCLGVLGNDEAGRELAADCAAAGMVCSLIAAPDRPTTCKTRVVGHAQQLLRLDEERSSPIRPHEYEQLSEALSGRLADLGALILSDYGKGVLSGDNAARVIAMARKAGVPVLVDPKGTDWQRYAGATCVTPNEGEFLAAAGLSDTSEPGFSTAAHAVRERLRLDWLLVTRGARGMSLYGSDPEPVHIPTRAREVYDVSGAGDTVIATLAGAVAAGYPMPDAAQLANAAAGVAVGKLGTQPVSMEELRLALAAEEGPRAKIRSRRDAARQVEAWRRNGRQVVFTNGCFDLLHVGHVKLLHAAAAFGDHLVVGLNSDASVRRLKGPSRPILPETERAALMAAIGCVDLVVLFDEDTPRELIFALKPDVLVKGGDYVRETVVGHELVESWGGRVELVPLEAGYSTSGLIEKLRKA